MLAVAWLDGLWVRAGERALLGFVELEGPEAAEAASRLRVFGADTNARERGRSVPLTIGNSSAPPGRLLFNRQ